MNPQIRFGEDLMSRVSYVMMNPGGEREMTRAVREAVAAWSSRSPPRRGIDAREILELTFVGNPIMHHLLLGIDPTELGGAPFALATNEAITLWATRARSARRAPERPRLRAALHRRPCRRRHRRRASSSETPHLADEMTLIVDIGTNAEIVLGNRHRLLAALLADRPGLRGRADLLRPAGRARRDRAGAYRSAQPSSRASR